MVTTSLNLKIMAGAWERTVDKLDSILLITSPWAYHSRDLDRRTGCMLTRVLLFGKSSSAWKARGALVLGASAVFGISVFTHPLGVWSLKDRLILTGLTLVAVVLGGDFCRDLTFGCNTLKHALYGSARKKPLIGSKAPGWLLSQKGQLALMAHMYAKMKLNKTQRETALALSEQFEGTLGELIVAAKELT